MTLQQKLAQLIETRKGSPKDLDDLSQEIAQGELDLIQKGVFNPETKTSASLVQQGVSFYEHIFLANIVTHKFQENLQVFAKLSFFYAQLEQLSEQSFQIISLQLMFLVSVDQMREYYSLLQSLKDNQKQRAEIQKVKEFTHQLNVGNYIQAQNEVKEISPFHLILLNNIQKSRKIDLCKIVNLCEEDITIGEIKNIFGVKDERSLKQL